VGLIPGAEFADGLNALIYLGRGDYQSAGLSFAAMAPFIGWGATGTKWGVKSINQLQQMVLKKQAPKTMINFHKGSSSIVGEIPHVHFSNGAALYIDGTWKEGFKQLTNAEKEFLLQHGWILPK